jgi:uncharacterized protein (DUF305 family)
VTPPSTSEASPQVGDASGAPEAPARTGLGRIVLAALLALAVGLAIGLLIPALARPADDSPEAGFARDMSDHHAQAVEMAMIEHERGSDPDVRLLAMDIGLTQQAQKGIMLAWLREWKLNPTGDQPAMAWMPDSTGAVRDGLMPGMATQAEMTQLRDATGTNVDIQFLKLMRVHHVGGIHMADGVLKLSDNPEVTWLAGSMKTGQTSELSAIDGLLAKLGAKA